MDWLNYIPKDNDVQVSKSKDFEACLSYSAIHIAEMLLLKKTGYFFEFSERALAKASDTQPWGNSLKNVVDALNGTGLILALDWPALTYAGNYEDIDWATYYAAIPQGVLNKAYRVKAQLRPFVTFDNGPAWTIVKTPSGQLHGVAALNPLQFYDSYQNFIKNFADGYPIQSQYELLLTFENMPNSEFIQKQGTREFGFYLPALSEDALKDKAMNLGINILKPDGKIDYTLAKQVTGL